MRNENFSLFLNKDRRSIVLNEGPKKLQDRKKSLEYFHFNEDHLGKIQEQQEKHLASLCLEDEYFSESKKVEDKIVHGLGTASIYETGFSLHHIYGVPYLPASSIKGMLRSYIIQELFDGSEKNALASEPFCCLFGCSKETSLEEEGKAADSEKEGYQGELIFFDAFPVESPKIKIDLLNTHYPTYYNSKDDAGAIEPPADWDSPNIVNFLTLYQPTFMFRFGLSKRVATKTETEKYTIKQEISWKDEKKESIENLFTQALQNHGLGAKTAVGYGFFK